MSDIKFEIPTPKALMAASSVRYRELTRCGQKPLAGGKIFTYEVNSTTLKPTYRDASGLTPNTNPVVLDAAGEADIYLDGAYRIVVKDKNDVVQKDMDNINGWIAGGVEAQLESLNMVLKESSESILQPYADALAAAAAAGAGANGWDSTLVADGSETQKQINDDSIRNFECVEDLIKYIPRKNKQKVNVKGYYKPTNFAIAQPYKGGGSRTYIESRKNENDGFICIFGWVLNLDEAPDAFQAGAKGDEVHDDSDHLQKLFNFTSVTEWQGGTVAHQSSLRLGNLVKIKKGKYRTTKPLYIGAGANIEFENSTGFNMSINDGTFIIPDFDNPLDFAIKSANFDVNGEIIPYDKFVTGEELDAHTYSNTHSIKIKNLAIFAKRQIFGGLKLTASPQSEISFYISNVDYGVAISSSWTSTLFGQTLHHKAGICGLSSNHNLKFDGYFDRLNQVTLPLSTGTNLINSDLLPSDKSCGIYAGASQAAVSVQLTAEYNYIGVLAYWCPLSIQSLYIEKSESYAVSASASSVKINQVTGFFNKRDFKIANNATISIDDYQLGNTENMQPEIITWQNEKNRLIVNHNYPYAFGNIVYQNTENIIYVSELLGSEKYTGFDKSKPAKTLQQAFNMITSVYTNGGSQFNKMTINILDGTHTLTNGILIDKNIEIKGISNAAIKFSNTSITLIDSKISIYDTSILVDNSFGYAVVASGGVNHLALNNCASYLSNSASLFSASNPSSTEIVLQNGIVAGSQYENIIDMPNNSLAMISFTSSANISSDITGRSDKGLKMPRDNAIKIFPSTLR